MDQVEWDSHLIKAKTKWIIDSEKERQMFLKFYLLEISVDYLLMKDYMFDLLVLLLIQSDKKSLISYHYWCYLLHKMVLFDWSWSVLWVEPVKHR